MLGDSYSGVFHYEDCKHAGITAHLAKELGVPIGLHLGQGMGPKVWGKLVRQGPDALKGKKLIQLLVGKNDEKGSEDRPQSSSGISHQNFMHKAREAYKDHFVLWGEEKFTKAFFEHNIFKLGTTLQCDVCARRSWHPVDALSYSIQCPHCPTS